MARYSEEDRAALREIAKGAEPIENFTVAGRAKRRLEKLRATPYVCTCDPRDAANGIFCDGCRARVG